jgi:formylglycine-generating enzyme required for sulfatase activity/acetyl esterase/lipase
MIKTLFATVGLVSLIFLSLGGTAPAQTPTAAPAAVPERVDVELMPDVVYDHKYALAMTFDVLKPKKNANGAGILVIISGGWHSTWFYPEVAIGGLYSGWFDGRRLMAEGFTIFLVRHGSGERFLLPEIMDDVRRSVRFIRANPKPYGVDPDRLGAVGCSSGGHLTLMLANASDEGVPNPKNWDWRLRYSDRIAAAVAYYPPTDIRPWFKNDKWKNFQAFGFDPALAGTYSPLLFVSPHSAPTLLLHGDKDPGVPIEHSQNILAEYKKNNVPCELITMKGEGHAFAGDDGHWPLDDNARLAAAARDAWFEKWLAKPQPKPEVKPPPEVKAPADAALKLAAQYAVADLSAGAAGPWPVTELDKAPDDLLKNDAWRTTRILLRRIPAGKFVMGTPAGEAAGELYAREYHAQDKQHTVTLTKAFYIGVFPVTQDQWSRVMGNDPSYFAGNPKRPVETVSWDDIRGGDWPAGNADAKSFIGRFRKGSSQSFDLPTEAQWEYACRAGTTRALNDPAANKGEGADCSDANLAAIAWFENNSEHHTHDVGLKAPNAWGLYDMCGNVSQWCLDWLCDYPADATDPVGPGLDKRAGGRILRGGYWSMYAPGCRSAARNYDTAPPNGPESHRYNVAGFRLVLPE